MSDEEKPRLWLAAENDPKDIAREFGKQAIGWPLRELAANFIRVVRGAGKSYEIGGQCVSVIEAFQQYREKVGHWPTSWEIDEALSIRRPTRENETYDEYWQRSQAHEEILRGALQVTASRLVRQLTQENRGHSEMMDGIRHIEQIKDERRQRLADEEKARRKSLRAKSGPSERPPRRKASTIRKKPKSDITS